MDQSETSISVSTNRKACLRIVVKLKCTYRTFYRGFAATRNYRGFWTNESRLGGNSKGEGSDFGQSVTASNFQDRSQIEMQNHRKNEKTPVNFTCIFNFQFSNYFRWFCGKNFDFCGGKFQISRFVSSCLSNGIDFLLISFFKISRSNAILMSKSPKNLPGLRKLSKHASIGLKFRT